VVAVRRRWRPVAIILGVVFLLTAGRLLKDAGHRQEVRVMLIVQGVGLASGAAGLALLLWSILYRPKILPPPRE
jgi:hypothetical protein